MSLPVCGVKYQNWAPYHSPVPLTQHVKQELYTDNCETAKACPNGVPTSMAELSKCATCAKKYTNLDRYYGCTWCQEVLAPLAAFGRALVLSEVQTYINQTPEQRKPVNDTWNTLTPCQQGYWVRRTCLANDNQTFPYSSAATGTSSSSHKLSPGAIVGIVVGVLLFLGFFAWVLRRIRKDKSGADPKEADLSSLDTVRSKIRLQHQLQDELLKMTEEVKNSEVIDARKLTRLKLQYIQAEKQAQTLSKKFHAQTRAFYDSYGEAPGLEPII